MRARVSLYGMQTMDHTIFNELVVPEALDKTLIINNIMLGAMDLEVVYPQPEFLKWSIGVWSRSRLEVWEKLWKTTQYEYNPIDNYDRTEEREWSESRDKTGTDNRNSTSSGTKSRTGTYNSNVDSNTSDRKTSESDTTGKTDDTTQETRSTLTDKAAYNSQTYEPVDKVESSVNQTHDNTVTGHVTNSENGSGTRSETGSGMDTDEESTTGRSTTINDSSENEDVDHKEKVRAHGNIGVTTTQQMIQQERDIVQFNLIQVIVNEFIERFCILVY